MKNASVLSTTVHLQPGEQRIRGFNDLRFQRSFPDDYDCMTAAQQRNYERGRQQCALLAGIQGMHPRDMPKWESSISYGDYVERYFGAQFRFGNIAYRASLQEYERLFK